MDAITYQDGELVLLDQRLLPAEETLIHYREPEPIAAAIRDMVVRGAPAIGITAAWGLAIGLASPRADPRARFEELAEVFAATRPTAVNLFWAIDRMRGRLTRDLASEADPGAGLLEEARAIHAEDIASCRRLGDLGAALLPDNATVLTHCNAGALATGGWGTALGVIRSAVLAGKTVAVLADETRPYLQGARLTAWEMEKENIPVHVITDGMAGHFLHSGEVDCVVVGADRIAANGDVANKIGTYQVAVLAKENGVPFYVAAPVSTIDPALADGSLIPIEERSSDEVIRFGGQLLTPVGVPARHPAFDVTPNRYVTAIITEKGVLKAPFDEAIARVFS